MVSESLRLQRGDKVALIAPASGQKQGDEYLLDNALSTLVQWGLSVEITPRLGGHRYLSANDNCRAADLSAALSYPEIKAIFITRGGYGCSRLLPYLSDVHIPTPRYLVGFSDVTTLHLYGLSQPQLISVHAPNLATQQFLADNVSAENNRNALYQFLFHGVTPRWQLTTLMKNRLSQQTSQHLDINADNVGEFARVGGCLSLLTASLGTPYEVQTAGKVLMIEEVGEAPYKIDRMLTQLRHAGKFDAVKAVVFGEMHNCHSPNIELQAVLADEFADDDFPILMTPCFGHGAVNLPWQYK